MKVTEYGKIVRKARIDADLTMLDMAKALGVSSAYLSALEVGKKRISDNLLTAVTNYLKEKLPMFDAEELKDAAAISNNALPLDIESTRQKFLVASFARTNMSEADMDDFQVLLDKVRMLNEKKNI